MTPDVNVLLAASRSDHPHHQRAYAWLQEALANAARGSGLKLQPMVIASFLRLATHPRIFVQPTSMPDALRFIDALLAADGVERPNLGQEWPALRALCLDKTLAANDLPDAWLAAAAIHQGEHVASFDADFRRLLPRSQFTLLTP
ncbi:MAG: PIN domain-containing protein [Rubrivivax sp.]|nr:PIN domain-containing protein [Rubrivivax sp.]